MPRKNRQLRPKNAAPEPDCRRTATNGGGTSKTARKFATVHVKFRFIRGIPDKRRTEGVILSYKPTARRRYPHRGVDDCRNFFVAGQPKTMKLSCLLERC